MKPNNYFHISLPFNNLIFQPPRIKLKRRCKRMKTNLHRHIAGVYVLPRKSLQQVYTYTHTQKAKNALNYDSQNNSRKS